MEGVVVSNENKEALDALAYIDSILAIVKDPPLVRTDQVRIQTARETIRKALESNGKA